MIDDLRIGPWTVWEDPEIKKGSFYGFSTTVTSAVELTGRGAVAALPASIRVGAFDIAIVKWPGRAALEVNAFGDFSRYEQRIRISDDIATVFKEVDTFIHELGHAIFWAYGIEDEDKEERIVSIQTTAWTQIYRDNPWFMTWVASFVA